MFVLEIIYLKIIISFQPTQDKVRRRLQWALDNNISAKWPWPNYAVDYVIPKTNPNGSLFQTLLRFIHRSPIVLTLPYTSWYIAHHLLQNIDGAIKIYEIFF